MRSEVILKLIGGRPVFRVDRHPVSGALPAEAPGPGLQGMPLIDRKTGKNSGPVGDGPPPPDRVAWLDR